MDRFIDVHAHCSNRSDDALISYARMNGLRYNLEELLVEMKKNNVTSGLLLSPPLESGLPLPNEDLMLLCERSEERLSPILTVEPNAASVSSAIRLAQKERFRVKGFKIRLGYVPVFADDPVFEPVYEYATQERLPILYHTGDTASSSGSLDRSHPLTLDRVANKRSELRMIICHMGNPWISDTAELVYKHPNLYADLSGLITGNSRYLDRYVSSLASRIQDAIYFAGGADKFLFGSDYPVQSYENSFALVRRLEVEPDDLQKIMWKNAERLFSFG